MNHPPQRHLFVVGFARSGTSLLYSFLNLHPQIKLLFEADVLSNSLAATSARSGQKWWERLDFYNSSCRRHGLTPLPEWKEVRSAKDAATALYRRYGGDAARYIGEKSPSYYDCLPELARQFPEAKIIVIWRHPHDIISSITSTGKKHYFFSDSSLPHRALIGFEHMQEDVLALRAQGIAVFDLCYEDLTEDPETWLKSICNFLEIPFDPRMLELERADYSMVPSGEHHAKVKSGRLVLSQRSREGSGNSTQQKIPRYISRWKTLFRDQLASKRYWQQAGDEKPGSFEVRYDRFHYNLARLYSEQLTPFIYGFFPLRLLQLYREWKWKAFRSSSGQPREKAPDDKRAPGVGLCTFSIVTPSYKQPDWLRLCAASVADQCAPGVGIEHIVQDSLSGPEIAEAVKSFPDLKLISEKDSGMYDAINRGWEKATGDVLCWLNCDEQYLPGVLKEVADYFRAHPEVEVLFADAIIVDNDGKYICSRPVLTPQLYHTWTVHLQTFSCSTFFRRSVLKERGFSLDARWKDLGDADLTVRMLNAGVKMDILRLYTSSFVDNGENRNLKPLARQEREILTSEAPRWVQFLRYFWILRHRLRRLVKGVYYYSLKPFAYEIYTLSSPQERVHFEVTHPTFYWAARMK